MTTIAAIATPPGEGAIGVIRVSGPESIQVVNQLFHGKNLLEQAANTIHFGRFLSAKGDFLDEVLVSIFKAPKSYTGEDSVEVSCHGSAYILEQILAEVVQQGVTLAEPGEFTMRAYLNGKMDLTQAEAVADLIASKSKAAHQLAANQLRGGITDEMASLREKLIEFAALIELELDFGEEDVEFADRQALHQLLDETRTKIHSLTSSFKLGNAIKQGVNTVITGRPNAGKSTLLNSLLKEDRAIVSEIAGTTRDTIDGLLNINGISFRLIDTAGIREASDTIEAIGIERTLKEIKRSSVVIYIFDSTILTPEDVAADLQSLAPMIGNDHDTPALPILLVANKADVPSNYRQADYEHLSDYPVLYLSAKADADMDKIRAALFDVFGGHQLLQADTIISNVRHMEALQNADRALAIAKDNLNAGISGDIIAMDIRQATQSIGSITGQIIADDLLGYIFGHFCIGK